MASAIGTGYDYSVSQYSPDGKIFQIDYAQKAVDNSTTVIGICFKNGIVLAIEKEVASRLYEPNTCNRIFNVDKNIGLAVSGLIADGRHIVTFARKTCKEHKQLTGENCPVKFLAQRIGLLMHSYTTSSGVRPFGCNVLLAAHEKNKSLLYCIHASGEFHPYHACAIGRDRLKAESLLEKVDRSTVLMDEGVVVAAKILHKILDEPKPQNVEFEFTFVGEFTLSKHVRVHSILHNRAQREALDPSNA